MINFFLYIKSLYTTILLSYCSNCQWNNDMVRWWACYMRHKLNSLIVCTVAFLLLMTSNRMYVNFHHIARIFWSKNVIVQVLILITRLIQLFFSITKWKFEGAARFYSHSAHEVLEHSLRFEGAEWNFEEETSYYSRPARGVLEPSRRFTQYPNSWLHKWKPIQATIFNV